MAESDSVPAGYRFYSFGTVAANKPIGDPVCEVIPLETANFINGEITDNGTVLNIDMTNASGKSIGTKGVISNSIPATWVGSESNRISPPDVRRGEEVILFTYADTGKYFWTPRNTNRWTRKLETVKFAFSGTTDEADKSVTPDNHYWLEFSSHKKHITLSTSSANGEKLRWFMEMRGSDGKFVIADDQGDEILIDGVRGHMRFINKYDLEVSLDQQNLFAKVPGYANVDIVGNATVKVGGNSDVTVSGNTTLTTSSYTVNAANITFNGKVMVNGDFSSTGTGSFGGSLSAPTANFPSGHGPH